MRAREMILAGAVLLAVGVVSSASAAVIQIDLGGINIRYDGADIVDTGTVAAPDPLDTATFIKDGVTQGTDTTGVTLDLKIPGVFGIPATGGDISGTVYSAAGGYLNLNLGGGEFLSLTLDSVSIDYTLKSSTLKFIFAGSSSSTIVGQSLPYGLSLDNPVSISFSTQVSKRTSAGGYITEFVSAGTGEIVPEPATLGLLAFGAVVLLRRRRAA